MIVHKSAGKTLDDRFARKMVCHPLPHPVQFMSKYVYFRAMQMYNVTGSVWCKLLLISWCDL